MSKTDKTGGGWSGGPGRVCRGRGQVSAELEGHGELEAVALAAREVADLLLLARPLELHTPGPRAGLRCAHAWSLRCAQASGKACTRIG
eukprot:1125181-Rhodomonas_salina.1